MTMEDVDVRSRRVSYTISWMGMWKIIPETSSRGSWVFGWGPPVIMMWVWRPLFVNRGCFLHKLPSSPFRGCWWNGLRYWRTGHLPVGGQYTLWGRLRGRLRRWTWICIGGWNCGRLDDISPSDDVIPYLAHVYLLGRWKGTLSFRSYSLICGEELSAAFRRKLSKRRLRFFPLHTDTVVRYEVSHAAKAMRHFPRDRASTEELVAPTWDGLGCLYAATRVAETLQR